MDKVESSTPRRKRGTNEDNDVALIFEPIELNWPTCDAISDTSASKALENLAPDCLDWLLFHFFFIR